MVKRTPLVITVNIPNIMERLNKYTRELPETTEEHTIGLNQRNPKRRNIEHCQETNFIGPFNAENQTVISDTNLRLPKFKPKIFKFSLLFPKLKPKIDLNLIKQPSINKLMTLLDIMYTESVHYHKCSNDIRDHEKIKRMYLELRKYLIELCLKKFCELWLSKIPSLSVISEKKLKQFIGTLVKNVKCKTPINNMNLKKFIVHNGSFMGYPKQPHLVLCINIIYSVFTYLLRKNSRMLNMMNKKKKNLRKEKEEKYSIKLYVKGTTKKKCFLEIVNEYKRIIKTEKLSFYQVADVKNAYEGILEPGQHIPEEEIDICANENYRFNIKDKISSDDKNDQIFLDNIKSTQGSAFDMLSSEPSPKIENCNKTLKRHYSLLEYVHGVQPSIFVDLENDKKNESIEKIETEIHIQSTSNGDRSIDMDISTDDLDRTITTNYSEAETFFKNLKLERVTNTLIKKRNSSNNHSKISERFNNKLSSHPITLTKSEKKMLSTIILADMDPYTVKWKRQKPSKRTRLFQVIVYFGSLKMGLCDKLHLDRLVLKGQNICDMIDIENLLKSIKIETCILQECFTFTEGKNCLIWPLGKMIVNDIISQRSPTINILFSLVKNITNKFCEKVKDFRSNSGLRIVLNKESLFESLSNVQIGKDVHKTELSLKYANVHTNLSPVNNDEFLNDMPGTSNSEHFCVTNTGFCIRKNNLNEEICKSIVNILKSDYSINRSWKECNNSQSFISNLLKAGVTLPIQESIAGYGSKFVEVYVRWFCEEYLQDDKFYKLAVSILKNIFLYIDTTIGCTDIKVDDAINNALMILCDQLCVSKAYESYQNTENHNDYKDVNISAIEDMQIEPNVDVQTGPIEPNVDVQTDPIDTKNVDMSLVPSKSSNLQSTNYDIDSDFLLQNLINENSDSLMENINVIDDSNNIFDNLDTDMMDIDDPNYNIFSGCNEFNEDSPFDDAIPTTVMPYDFNLSNGILGSNLEFQQTKNIENIDQVPINSFDPFINFGEKEEETNLQLQQAKNMEELYMISSDQLVNFDQNDEISLNELGESDDNLCGFYNAGLLLPP